MPTLANLTEEELLAVAEGLEEKLAELEETIASRAPGLRARPEEEQEIQRTRTRLAAVYAQLQERWPEQYAGGAPS